MDPHTALQHTTPSFSGRSTDWWLTLALAYTINPLLPPAKINHLSLEQLLNLLFYYTLLEEQDKEIR